jgi:ABC-type glycerol-3-phosphate transport system substrate-binding protein
VGLPYALQGVVLFGIKLSCSAVTFDEMAALAKSATQGEIIGADLERSFFFSGGHLAGVGGALIGADGEPAFNNEAGLKWIELLKALENIGPTEFLSDRDVDLFKQGRIGWIIDGTWNIPALVEAIGKENLAIDPWPSSGGGLLAMSNRPTFISAPNRKLQALQPEFHEPFSPESQSLLTEAGFIPSVSGAKCSIPFWIDWLCSDDSWRMATISRASELPVYFGAIEQALQSILSRTAASRSPANCPGSC